MKTIQMYIKTYENLNGCHKATDLRVSILATSILKSQAPGRDAWKCV